VGHTLLNAYNANGSPLRYLDVPSFCGEENKIIFWGEPVYIEVKDVERWLELEIPANKTEKDLIIIES